ncbi:unnamed protein product [Linum tenue]|uniref:Uncharacterized protein n=1 Tax=Linum tenue TaxID=586396 RepID=A0AAV0KZC1_9ROSI|nr:unnamed protein product [Linum tenue]
MFNCLQNKVKKTWFYQNRPAIFDQCSRHRVTRLALYARHPAESNIVSSLRGHTWSVVLSTLVNEPLRLGLAVLSFFDELRHLGHHTVFSQGRGFHTDVATEVDGPSPDSRILLLRNREGLSSQRLLVDLALPIHHDSIYRDGLAGLDSHDRVHLHLIDVNFFPCLGYGGLVRCDAHQRSHHCIGL